MEIKHYKVIFYALALMLAPHAMAQQSGEPDSKTGFMGKGNVTADGHMTLEPSPGKQQKQRTYGEGRGDANNQSASERFTKPPKLKQKKK